jgi:SLT domain-containing protein
MAKITADERARLQAEQVRIVADWATDLPKILRDAMTEQARRGETFADICTPYIKTHAALDLVSDEFKKDVQERIGAPLRTQIAAHVGYGVRVDDRGFRAPANRKPDWIQTREFQLCGRVTW